jgi:hypothetical protein
MERGRLTGRALIGFDCEPVHASEADRNEQASLRAAFKSMVSLRTGRSKTLRLSNPGSRRPASKRMAHGLPSRCRNGKAMHNFTPITATIGGILIGASASAMLLFNGKVAGISGIFAGVLRPVKGDTLWKVFFLAGLFVGGLLLRILDPHAYDFGIIRSPSLLVLAGLLVGFGTRLGNGCTSGHGVCGISRLSARSIVATITFIATGAATVYLINH